MDTTMHTTARAAREAGEAAGLTGQALDLYIQAGAPARHEARVERALSVALGEGGSAAVAWALLAVDMIGIGGRLGAGGEATSRLPALAGLGKGRKQASDGAAWSAAIGDAAHRLAHRLTGAEAPRRVGLDDARDAAANELSQLGY